MTFVLNLEHMLQNLMDNAYVACDEWYGISHMAQITENTTHSSRVTVGARNPKSFVSKTLCRDNNT
jgi:hypothetical protein